MFDGGGSGVRLFVCEQESLVLGTLGEQVKSQESREASLAAAQNKHEADAACSGMCAQGQGPDKDTTRHDRPVADCSAAAQRQHTCSMHQHH